MKVVHDTNVLAAAFLTEGICYKILACTTVSRADHLAAGDEDLLVIKQYGRTKIFTPKDFEILFADQRRGGGLPGGRWSYGNVPCSLTAHSQARSLINSDPVRTTPTLMPW